MSGVSSREHNGSPEDDERAASTKTVANRVKTALDALRERLRSVVRPTQTTDTKPSRSETPTEMMNCTEFDSFPKRAHPLTHPGRDLSDINPTDVVAIETTDGVRLSVPENPDATITSDVTVPIER
ncbi:hypothetical protein BRC91_07720 [Halobacteriales archaeon QS_4_62_28]|nr:MAG: hypothetical protein BRC91_07720 [Halobacteriales archaeon QS_4_62_28]